MQQNNNKNNKKFRSSYIGVIIISILMIVGVYLMITQGFAKPDDLSYNDFWSYLENDKIQTMTITPAVGENNQNYVITGKYTNSDGEEKKYEIVLPVSVVNEKILTPSENGDFNYSVNPKLKQVTTFDFFFSCNFPFMLEIFS